MTKTELAFVFRVLAGGHDITVAKRRAALALLHTEIGLAEAPTADDNARFAAFVQCHAEAYRQGVLQGSQTARAFYERENAKVCE